MSKLMAGIGATAARLRAPIEDLCGLAKSAIVPRVKRRKVAVLARLALAITVAVLAACAGTAATTTAYTPITGVLVRSDALVSGIGCGTRGDQVFKYAAVVTQGNQTLTVGATGVGTLSECYADAKFANLVAGPDGTLSFTVEIFAFSQESYLAQRARGLDLAVTDWTQLQKFQPTYRTSCRATQQQDVEVLAVCNPLRSGGPASIRIPTTQFSTTIGTTLACKDAQGKPKDYTKVQAFYSVGGVAGELSQVDCPDALVVTPAAAPATYTLDLQLVDPTGVRVVGTVRCTASTIPGLESTASCTPAVP